MKDPGPVALRAIADAEANIGVHEEGGNNAGLYVEKYLHDVGLSRGAPWCAAFVHFRLHTAARALGLSLPDSFPESGYCPDYQAWARSHGLWIPVADAHAGKTAVKRGDQCLFWFAAKGRVAHTGLVAAGADGGVVTVEGNTSDNSGVDREGDGVFKKHRDWQAFGAYGGFVRIPW